jgi:hypothetical protein
MTYNEAVARARMAYGQIKTAGGYDANGNYQLSELEERINKLWLDGKLSEEDRDELLQLAADNARDDMQIDIVARIAQIEQDIWELKHPVDIYRIWEPQMQVQKHEIVRYDVTGDGELDLCQYNGGRAYTSLSIGKIEGWNMLDRELNITHAITRDASGGYVLTPVEPEPTEAETAAIEGE